MSKNKFSLLCFVLIVSSLLLTGCFNSNLFNDYGDLSLQIDLPDQLTSQYTNYEFTLSQMIVTLTQDEQQIVQTIEPTNQTFSTTFSNLTPGTWTLEVVAKDEGGYSVYSAIDTANITSDNLTTLAIELGYTPGQLNVEVTLPQELDIASGTVILTDPTDQTNQLVQNLTIGTSLATTIFADLQASVWTLEVELLDASGSLVRSGNSSINILPGHTENLQIALLASGGLQLTFDTITPPTKPTGLEAKSSYGSASVSWNPNPEYNIAEYILYASDSEAGRKVPIIFTTNTSGHDYNGLGKAERWYWVQAIDDDGYSSELSDPVVFVNHENIDYKFSFSMSDFVCTVDYDGSNYREWLLANSPTVSPDGRYIAASKSGLLHIIRTDDSGVTTLPQEYFQWSIIPWQTSWSPDSSKVVFTDHLADSTTNCLNLNIYDLNQDMYYLITDYPAVEYHPLNIAWSPEGSTIAYTLVIDNGFTAVTSELYTVNATTGTEKQKLSDYENVSSVAWSPDGRKLAFVDRITSTEKNLYIINPDGTGETLLASGDIRGYSWSPDGSQIVYAYRTTYDYTLLATINTDGTENTDLNFGADDLSDFIWAPNGKLIIAFANLGDVGSRIAEYDIETTGVVNLFDSVDTSNPGRITHLSIFSTNY